MPTALKTGGVVAGHRDQQFDVVQSQPGSSHQQDAHTHQQRRVRGIYRNPLPYGTEQDVHSEKERGTVPWAGATAAASGWRALSMKCTAVAHAKAGTASSYVSEIKARQRFRRSGLNALLCTACAAAAAGISQRAQAQA